MILGLFLSFFILLAVGVPVAFSLGLSSFFYVLMAKIPLLIIPQKMYAGIDSFVLLSIPAFVLAGNLMNRGGITDRIIKFSNAIIGHIRGGLSLANIVASMIFAGISGTAVSDVASIGAVLIPTMEEEGYDVDFAAAITAASSTLAPIIPPSLPMIVAGTLTGISVSKLFMAGVVPGILLGLLQMALSYYISKRDNHPKGEKTTFKEKMSAFYGGIWALLMTVIILFGILGGYFTPTEASVIAVIYGLFVGGFIYKELKIKDLPGILIDTLVTTASIMILVGFANLFAWIMASEQIPQMIANGMLSITNNKYIILILINILLLIVGMFMETISALVILFPVLLKVTTAVGVHPIQFAVMAVFNLVIGLLTPPVGVCLFVASSIAKISIGRITKAIMPFLIISLIVLLLITFVPAITLFVPNLLYGV